MEMFVVSSRMVWEYPNEAARLARLGALANAIVSLMSMQSGSMAIGVAKQRDSLQATLMIVGYLKEAVEVFNNQNNRGLIADGVEAGYRLPRPLDEMWEPFAKGRESFYEQIAITIRNTKAFHVDETSFVKWAQGLQAPSVTLWRKESSAPVDWVFTTSAQIQSFMGARLDTESLRVLEKGAMISFLVEAMAWGLVARAGMDPRACYTVAVLREVTIDYTFKDGRLPLTETVRMTTDLAGRLDSFAGTIRGHVTRVFGGPMAGAMQSEPGQVTLSSPRGTARARLGIEVPARHPGDPRMMAMRMGDMAAWGTLRAKAAMEFSDRVRTGQVTPEETAAFADSLRSDLAYWEARERESEQATRSIRE